MCGARVLRVMRYNATLTQHRVKRAFAHTAHCVSARVNPSDRPIIETARILCGRLMLRSSRHARIGGPNRGCSNSLRSRAGLLFAKHQAAINTKIVVGKPGTNNPTVPIATKRKPAPVSKSRTALF